MPFLLDKLFENMITLCNCLAISLSLLYGDTNEQRATTPESAKSLPTLIEGIHKELTKLICKELAI